MRQNITIFGEGLIGLAAGTAGGIMIATGTCPPAGMALLVGGIVIAGKGLYDFYVTSEIAEAATAAAARYCDCKAIIQ